MKSPYLIILFFLFGCQHNKQWVCKGNCDNGFGDQQWKDGSYAIGHWINSKLSGSGEKFFGTSSEFVGDKYIGEFKNDNFDGHGMYFDSSEDSRHTGEFKNGIPNGYGVTQFGPRAKYPNSHYEGQYKNGIYEGFGKLSFGTTGAYAGNKYVGYFINGKFGGQGKYSWPGIGYYAGAFKDNYREGKGTFVFEDGTVFNGVWVDDYNAEFSKLLKLHKPPIKSPDTPSVYPNKAYGH